MNKSKINKITGHLILVSAAMIWGLSFVAQKNGMQYVEGFTFTTIRMFLAAFTLLPIVLVNRKKNNNSIKTADKKSTKKTFTAIILVGLCLFTGINLQQFAFNYIEAGKVGFITALYMLLVPIIGLFLKKRPPFTVWIGVALGTVALYLICMGGKSEFSVGRGELLTLLCAAAFALHIIVIDRFAAEVDSIELSCGQFFVTAVLSLPLMLIFEKPSWTGISQALIPIVYAGVFSSAVAFTFQIIGQKRTEPAIASMLLCLESVFSVIFSFILPPHERMAVPEYIGCGIMFAAILIAQITPKKSR